VSRAKLKRSKCSWAMLGTKNSLRRSMFKKRKEEDDILYYL